MSLPMSSLCFDPVVFFFFFSSRRRHTRSDRDWSSDVCSSDLDRTAEQRARELLELERNALRMFTSCGWFFDDIAGIETIQILRYAARAIELAGADAPRLEAGVLERLARAHSNEPGEGTGRDVYLNHVKRRVPVELASRSDAQAGDPGGDAAR